MAKASDPKNDGFFNDSFIRRYAEFVTELRFSSKIKIVKRSFNDNSGWMLLVEGVAGGYAMNFVTRKLYHTGQSEFNVFNDGEFFTSDIWSFEELIIDLVTNLGTEQRVVDPSKGFISKYLNDISFNRQHAHWQSDESSIELKAR